MDFLERVYWGNSLTAYVIAAGITVGVVVALEVTRRVLAGRLRALAKNTENRLDDLAVELMASTKFLVTLVVGIYAGTSTLWLDARLEHVLRGVTVLAVAIQVGLWVGAAITFSFADYRKRKEEEGDTASLGVVMVLSKVARLALWVVIFVIILDNLGVDVTALIAGLSIGAVALALAIQSTLSDLFAAVSILLDKPFEVGDYVTVGDDGGTIENIGIKTTRVRTSQGEQLVFGNNDLLSSRIRNFKRMNQRRVDLTVRVTYETPADKVAAIPATIQAAIESRDKTRFDRAHFKELGESALIFEAVYYMTEPDYRLFMDTQQAVNLELLSALERDGIEFAYPTQTVHLRQG